MTANRVIHLRSGDGCIEMEIVGRHPLRLESVRYFNGRKFRIVDPEFLDMYAHVPRRGQICDMAPYDNREPHIRKFGVDDEIHVMRGFTCIPMFIVSINPLKARGEDRQRATIDERNIHQVHLPEDCPFRKQE